MSRPGEAEAVEAVLQTAWRDSPFEFDKHANHVLDGGCAVCHKDVPAIIAAAYPVIERAVREQLATEYARRSANSADRVPLYSTDKAAYFKGGSDGFGIAADIARGDT